MENLKERFIEDAFDLIAKLENDLLELDKNREEKSLIEQVFRVMHTLKGVSGMYGFDNVGELTHHLETVYDFIREGRLLITDEIINITFTSIDHIKYLLQDEKNNELSNLQKQSEILQKIVNIISEIEENIKTYKSLKQQTPSLKNTETTRTYYISFKPDSDILERGINALALFEELNILGQTVILPYSNKIPDCQNIEPEKCYLYWDVYLATKSEESLIEEVFIFVQDERQIKKISAENLFELPNFLDEIEPFTRKEENIDEAKINLFIQRISKEKNAIIEKKQTQITSENLEHKIQSIRVSSEKLDVLLNLVSEFITSQAELSLIAEQLENNRLTAVAENLEKLSRQLRENAFSICLIPISEMLVRFQRLVRDLSAELKKEINFVTEGAETELDKTMIDSLADPLMHILRNSIDHGIEFPEIREQKGKPRKGKIIFKAFYSGANVYIQVSDDGSGINLQKVRSTAIRKGFISQDAQLTDKDLITLTFTPGFSTADNISEVSGRGVGMDVVKRKIAEIRGEVTIDTIKDTGTTISIKLPLTLSIVDALWVKIDTSHFLIPLGVVDFCSEIKHNDLKLISNNRIAIEGQLFPFVYLRKEFQIKANLPETERCVIIKYEDIKVALIVDIVIGEHQAVLKPIGEIFNYQDIISGASILGDGDLALVLDTNRLIKNFKNKSAIFK